MSRMNLDTAIRLSAQVKGANTIQAFNRDLKGLDQAAKLSKAELGRMNIAINQMARSAGNTTAGLRQHVAALQTLRDRVEIGGKAYNRLGVEIDQLQRKLRGLDGQVERSKGSFNGLGVAAAAAAAATALIGAGRFVFDKTAELETQTRSLQVLTGSAAQAKQIIQELQQLGAVTPFTSTELIDSAKRLQAFGVETSKVVDITRRLADVSGATGAELQGIVTAYGQVQAKGRLQGEELLQFQERGVALQQALQQQYGMTGEEFQKALEKGQISAAAVEYALISLTNAGDKYANGAIAQSDTLAGRLSTVQDGVDALAREVGKLLTPALLQVLEGANERLSQTPRFIEDVSLAFQYAAGQLQPFLNGLQQLQWFFTNLTPPGWAMQVIGGALQRGGNVIGGLAAQQRQAQQRSFIGPPAPQMQGPAVPDRLRQRAATPPPLLGRGAGSGAAGGAGGAGGSGGGGAAAAKAFQPSSRARALIAAAQKLGVSPLDLATIISFETGGTFSPSKWGGAGGNYMGLIQFGPNERKAYGASPNQSFEEQVTGPVVRYFQDRFGKVGMKTQGASLLDLYTTVLAGNPRANRNARDSFGTSPTSGVARMGPHRQKAIQTFFGGSADNAGLDAMDMASNANQLWETQQQQLKAANEQNAKLKDQLALVQETNRWKQAELEYDIKKNEIAREYDELKRNAASAEELTLINANQQIEARIAQLDYERQLNDMLAEREELMVNIRRAAAMPTVYNELETQQAALDAVLEKYPAIGAAADAAANMATAGVREMVAGTKTAEQVFVDFLTAIADALMDTAKQMIAQYIAIGIARMFAGMSSQTGESFTPVDSLPSAGIGFSDPSAFNFNPGAITDSGIGGVPSIGSTFPGRAIGGPTMAGRPYKVGENGPELFVPYQSGTIIPADDTERVMTPMILPFQGRTAVTGNMATSAAVPFLKGGDSTQLVVPFQKGSSDGSGELASSNVIDVEVKTVTINQVEYATVDQLRAATKYAASQGAELAHKRYVNNPTRRRQAGF